MVTMMLEKEDEEKAEEAGAPTSVRRTEESTSSITVDPTTLDEKEESQLKEAIQKAMLDEKGQDKGYFTIEEVTSLLTTLPLTKWTESKVDRVIQEWCDRGRLMERQGIGKYTPV
jgi:polyhydroxyalkanoate synthesis regulator phasin